MNVSTRVARAVLGELVHQGVREVVLAPGSRSAPLAFEALRLSRAGVLRLHVRLDERSAAFLALGLAKASGAAVAVVCTSGTAVANLAPAVVEASYSAIPLVVVTADRPPESRGVGSPQTIDQVGFFGEMVRASTDLTTARGSSAGDPESIERAARATVASMLRSALADGRSRTGADPARGPHTGPVHLNVGFRMPLVPELGEVADPAPAVGSPPRVRRTPLPGCDCRDLGSLIGEVPARGVLLVGDLPPEPLAGHHQWLVELAERCGWPIVAEPTANLHPAAATLAHAPLVLGSEPFMDAHTPDLVVSVGLFGLSRPTLELLRRSRRHVALDLSDVGREICDPLRTASQVLGAIPLPPDDVEPDPQWLADWQHADRIAADRVADRLGVGFSGTSAVRQLWQRLADDALLLVAASWPVRQLELAGGRRQGVAVIGNRGANGIDGLVSTAWGAALAHQARGGGRAYAILGDLAFLHDQNGLLAGADEPRPDLTLVVLDNNGGGIFHQLEQGSADYRGEFERIFGTPQDRDLVAVAGAAGVPVVRVADPAGLAEQLADLRPGVRLIVVDVPDREAEAALLAEVRADVAHALT